jgi:hypothetical protein
LKKLALNLKISAILLLLAVSACAHAGEPKSISSTLATVDGKSTWIKCPAWDWDLVPAECRFPGFNCVPTCGKWPGDKMDIGAMQYIPGQTSQKPWGDWAGVPFKSAPGEMAPVQNFRIAPPPPPSLLQIIGVKIK